MTTIRGLRSIALLGLVLLLASGCAAGEPDGPTFTPTIEITDAHVIGQSFLAEWDGLRSVDVYLTPSGPLPESLRVSLYKDRDDRLPLWAGDIPLSPGQAPGWFRIPMAVQPDSAAETYFLAFEMKSDRRVDLSTGPGGFYIHGALHRDGQPLDRQLEFRPGYQPARALAGLLADGFPALAVLAGFAVLFTLPGWALLGWLWEGWGRFGALEKTILATGTGLAVYPVILLLPWLVDVPAGALVAWAVPTAALGSYGWRWYREGWRPQVSLPRPDLLSLLIMTAAAAVLVSRLLPLRLLEAGMWGDSVHHTLITRLMVERGGLFASWEPYAPILTFTYHFGFHAAAAAVTWVLGLGEAQAVLWVGQVLNVLAVLGLVPLMSALARDEEGKPAAAGRLAGLVALVTAGLASPMPMFYTNWGRYTQLAGQALLLVWMVVALEGYRVGGRGWRREVPGWLLLAGLGLTHYRVLIFALLWIAAYWLVNLRRVGVFEAVIRTWSSGYGAALLFLPWFWNVFGGRLMEILGTQLTTPPGAVPEAVENYTRIGELTRFLPLPVWGLATLALIWGLQRSDRAAGQFTLWSLFLLLAANPGWLGLPGSGAINSFAVLLAAYIPAGVLLGRAAGWGLGLLEGRMPTGGAGFRAGVVLAAAAAGIWGAAAQADLVNPRGNALVTRPDTAAYAWVQQAVPEDAVFLVNMVAAGSGSTLAGTDGGWWLPYFTGRRVLVPPFIAISEKTKPPDLRLDLLDLAGLLSARDMDDPEVVAALQAHGVTHVYLGQQQGSVNGREARIPVGQLLDSGHYDLLYHVDRVWVFRFEP